MFSFPSFSSHRSAKIRTAALVSAPFAEEDCGFREEGYLPSLAPSSHPPPPLPGRGPRCSPCAGGACSGHPRSSRRCRMSRQKNKKAKKKRQCPPKLGVVATDLHGGDRGERMEGGSVGSRTRGAIPTRRAGSVNVTLTNGRKTGKVISNDCEGLQGKREKAEEVSGLLLGLRNICLFLSKEGMGGEVSKS